MTLIAVVLLALSVSPRFSYAPASLHLRATVERASANRLLHLELDGPFFYRSSDFQIDGDAGPRTIWWEIRDVPAGDYLAIAVLERVGEKPLREVESLLVL